MSEKLSSHALCLESNVSSHLDKHLPRVQIHHHVLLLFSTFES